MPAAGRKSAVEFFIGTAQIRFAAFPAPSDLPLTEKPPSGGFFHGDGRCLGRTKFANLLNWNESGEQRERWLSRLRVPDDILRR